MNIQIKVSKKAIFQTLLIYIMIIFNQTILYEVTIKKYAVPIVAILFVYLFLKKGLNFHSDYGVSISLILLMLVVWVRFFVGGVGISAWAGWSSMILITVVAVGVDVDKFFPRYIKVVSVLAVVSIVGYIFDLINPDIWARITPFTTTSIMGNSLNGMFLYVTGDMERNRGLFSEPGVYQMVLNSALFILLFLKDKLSMVKRERVIHICIFVIAVITCQSTTGYMGLSALFLSLGFRGDAIKNKVKIRIMVLAVVIALLIEFLVNGESGLVGGQLFAKLINLDWSGQVNLGSTGYYRVNFLYKCLETIKQYPWGVGFDYIEAIIENTGGVGMALFQFTAAMGVISGIVVVIWLAIPFIKNRNIGKVEILLYAFLYINTMLAQTTPFYPALIMFPIYFMEKKYRSRGDVKLCM